VLNFGAENFDRYPKGSGCFFAPREVLSKAFADLPTRYADARHANDDTPMLRGIAASNDINLSPCFASDYEPRATFRSFATHSFHRGIVFLDGHGRRESRFFPAIIAFFPVTGAIVAVLLIRPKTVPAVIAGTAAPAAALAILARRSRGEVTVVAGLAPLWAVAFGAGMWRGLGMATAAAFRRRFSPSPPEHPEPAWK
jgi:hypothetical protein